MAYKNSLSVWTKVYNKFYLAENRKNPHLSKAQKMVNLMHLFESQVKEGNHDFMPTVYVSKCIMCDEFGYSRHYYMELVEAILYKYMFENSPTLNKYGEFSKSAKNLANAFDVVSGNTGGFARGAVDASIERNKFIFATFTIHGHKFAHTFYVEMGKTSDDTMRFDITTVDEKGVSTSHFTFNEEFDDDRMMNDKDESIRTSYIHTKIFVNFLLYANTFPDCILDRLPKDVSAKKNKGQTIRMAESVRPDESERKLGITFFRSGHFVTFTSPRYKGARFKTVWRKSTIVNKHDSDISSVVEPMD